MDKNYVVTKSNYFIMNTNYDLSLEEQKLILTLASMVQPEDEEFKPYIFKISDFMQLLGVKNQAKYTEIPKITKELMKKVFEIQEGNKLIQTAWLSGAIYEKGTGYVTLKFNPDLKPYMLKLNSMFTQYKLANILSMKSKYSPRVYEILKCNEFKKQGFIEIEIDELRKLLRADEIYPRYYDFRRFILEATQKELKKLTDISFDFEEQRFGRKVISIKFFIKSNKEKTIVPKQKQAEDEVSVTLETETPLDILEKSIREVMTITENRFTEKNASTFWGDSNGDIELIYKAYEYMKTKAIKKSKVGYMRTLLKTFEEPQKLEKVDYNGFNNFKPREYDYDSLEKKLLGWEV